MTEFELIIGARAIADALSLPRRRIYELIDAGQIPTIKVGGSVAIRKVKLLEWVKSLEAA